MFTILLILLTSDKLLFLSYLNITNIIIYEISYHKTEAFTIYFQHFLDFHGNSWYSLDVIKYDTEKLNIDIPHFTHLEEPLELKVPELVYVLFKGNEFNE